MSVSYCEDADKVGFSSKRAARKSLTGQLKSKRIRIYPCAYHRDHYHMTKEGSTRLHEHRNA